MSLPPWLSINSLKYNTTPKRFPVKKVNNRRPYLAPPRIRTPYTEENFENEILNMSPISPLSSNSSNNGSINSSPPNNNRNSLPPNLPNNVVVTPVVNKKASAPRLPNGTVNYNAMARKWKANVNAGTVKVTAKAKNTRTLAQQVANLSQKNRNIMNRNKKALMKAVMGNSSIKNKSYFMGPTPGLIPANMKKRFFEENARLAATQKAQAKQSALNALKRQKGPNVNRHTSTRRKSRKNRRN